MTEGPFDIVQQIFKSPHPTIRVHVHHENELTREVIEAFLATTTDGAIGIAPAYGPKCVVGTLAFSSTSHVLLIRLSKPGSRSQKNKRKKNARTGHDLLKDLILCDSTRFKYAFQMNKLATALHLDLDLRINNAVDLLSACKPSSDRHSLDALLHILGGETTLNKLQVSTLFKDEENISAPIHSTAMQAWAAYQASHLDCMSKPLARVAKIYTDLINREVSFCSILHSFLLTIIYPPSISMFSQKPSAIPADSLH
jgi:hypothetical protein